MTTRLLFWFPTILAICVGAALIVVGNATAAPVGQNWLGFCGSIIGSALAAGTGYWLIVVRENREREGKFDAAIEALGEIAHDFTALQAVLDGSKKMNTALYYRLAHHKEMLVAVAKMIETLSPSAYLIIEVLRTDITYNWKQYLVDLGFTDDDFDFAARYGTGNDYVSILIMRQECETSRGSCAEAIEKIKARRRNHAATPA